MNWIEIKASCQYCDTPIGKISLEKNENTYEIYHIDKWITDAENLNRAKEEAKIYLIQTFYKLKIYLELND